MVSVVAELASLLHEMNILMATTSSFLPRHIGPSRSDLSGMLYTVGHGTLDELISEAVPGGIRMDGSMDLPDALTETDALAWLRAWMGQNAVLKSFIGQGYHGTITPGVILRNIMENPGWYTAYTPYQAEISQGRLEALLNFQTMVTDLTGLDVSNASLLDEGTAAAEAMMMCHRVKIGARPDPGVFFVSKKCHPQTIDIVKTRANPLGINVIVGDHLTFDFGNIDGKLFGVLVQYPDTTGSIHDFESFFAKTHEANALTVVATDLLALTLLRAPGEFGADVAVGSAQRFGVPMGFGGPHAGFLATKDAHKRQMPGRLVGVSKDAQGNPAMRLALGTREQHIRRDKATSNICTAQVLLGVMASMYAVYHGPEGLQAHRIAGISTLTARVGCKRLLPSSGRSVNAEDGAVFDSADQWWRHRNSWEPRGCGCLPAWLINLRLNRRQHTVGLSLDETATLAEDRWALL